MKYNISHFQNGVHISLSLFINSGNNECKEVVFSVCDRILFNKQFWKGSARVIKISNASSNLYITPIRGKKNKTKKHLQLLFNNTQQIIKADRIKIREDLRHHKRQKGHLTNEIYKMRLD